MTRCGITSMGSFKKVIQDFPDDYAIGTNYVGNIAIYKPDEKYGVKMIGFIELQGINFYDRMNLVDCEFTSIEKIEYF